MRPSNRRPGVGRRAALLALACGLAACGGGPADPPDRSGTAVVSLEGALPDDGAMLLVVTGDASSPLSARADVQLHARAQSGVLRIALFGPLDGGTLFTLTLPDTTTPPLVTILEVAASDGELRPSVAGYTIRMTLQ